MPIATLPNATSYSLTGEDAAIFQIDTVTGEVSYQPWFTPSYAEVWDLDRDHIYEISVIGTDSLGMEVGRVALELVVSETDDAVWRNADTGHIVEPGAPGGDPIPPEIDPTEPNDTVTYTLAGEDAAIFQIDAATGEVSYQSWFTPSFTEVWDLDRDHIYEIEVVGSDATGAEVSRTALELVVSEDDAVWRTADGEAPTDPVAPPDPVDPADPTQPTGAESYVLAGEDASIFQVNATTGEVSYQSWFTPSYDQVWDLDRDHIYEIEVIGLDSAGVEVSRTGLELVVSETDAVWRAVEGSDPIEPVPPVDPIDPIEPVIVIERLDGDARETLYGIRDDTSSRGVDLAGAVVIATFADGSVETLTWEAYDPYTLGGAVGTDITLAYGWSEHELTVSKELASLQIDLAPASSVFDTTETLDDDPLGGSTAGSSFGYEFGLLGDYGDLGGAVTATYSGIVNLVGSAAQGDLYTTLFLDFSTLTDGGILGDVTWNSDIDTLRYQGDLVAAGTSDANAGDDILTGTDDADFLSGSNGADRIFGLGGNDVLAGGADADEFAFANGSGDDLIVDFDILGGDVLDVQAFGFADVDAVLAATVDVGADALIQLDADDSLLLAGVNIDELDASHNWLLTA